MKKMLSMLLVLALLMGLMPMALAEGSAPIVIRMGILDGWTGFPTKYVVDTGMDTAAGLDIEYLVFSSGAPANEAMISGDIDCAVIGGGASVPALANLNSKLIMEVNDDTVGMSLIARAGLDCNTAESGKEGVLGTPETIKGKTILTASGTLQYYLTLKYLEAIGVSDKDVNLVSMDANQGYQAFQLGQGDILACSNNYSFGLVKEGNVELASLRTLGCSATAQIVCSDAAFNDPTKRQGLAILCQLLAQVGDIMNGDTELATKSYVEWVKLNGGNQDEEIARAIMECKPYYGVEATKARTLGSDFLNNFVEFYIMTEQIEPEQRGDIEANIREEVLLEAGLK